MLWFDEHYHDHVDYQMAGVADVISDWTTLVFVGTSHAVGITDTLLEAAEHDGLPIFNIDLVAAYLPGVHDIVGPAEVVLPRLAEAVATRLDVEKPASEVLGQRPPDHP